LLLILGLASLASATLQISVGGNQEPVDSEIVVDAPSGELILDIWTDTAISAGVGEGYYALVCLPAGASITGGVSQYPTEPGIAHYGGTDPGLDPPASLSGLPGMPAGTEGVWGSIIITGVIPNVPVGGTIIDDILFHCNAEGDVIVQLVYSPDYMTGSIVDQVTIHQVPEPMTIALLGLGGLLLRRRK